ncbi:unnamed protein product [Calicophoron daubneyi]|uniref:VWFA and cache domain-containing protein 1 n=1 Tax=Calicophoron daubneyi TaxID=300641 RepID=A0AAV2TE61_CALDB
MCTFFKMNANVFVLLAVSLHVQIAHIPGQAQTENPSVVDPPGHESVVRYVEVAERQLSRLARDEMGVMALQAAFDSMEYQDRPSVNGTALLNSLCSKFANRIRDYTHLVTSTHDLASRLYRAHKRSPMAPRFECCKLSERDLRYDPVYGCRVSRRKCCDLIPRNLSPTSFNPGHNLTERFQRQLEYWPNVKWFYFITSEGLHSEFPAHTFQGFGAPDWNSPSSFHSVARTQRNSLHQTSHYTLPNVYSCNTLHQLRHRDMFVRSVVPSPIWMMIVLDQGEASQTQLLLGQRVAQLLLSSLSEKDRVSVFFASDTIVYPSRSPLYSHPMNQTAKKTGEETDHSSQHGEFYDATEEAKLFLGTFITSARQPLPVKTNHSLALRAAFELLRRTVSPSSRDGLESKNVLLTYISRGYLSDISETATTLREVAYQEALLKNQVRISAYMTVEEKSATVLFEKTFMSELATRWDAYSPKDLGPLPPMMPGHFFAVNRTTDLSETIGIFYKLFLPTSGPFNSAQCNSHPHHDDNIPDDAAVVENKEQEFTNPPDPESLKKNSQCEDNHCESPVPPVQYSLPYHDVEGDDLVMSISQAFFDEGSFFGVMGIDLHLADILDDIVHFSDSASASGAGSSTVFLIHAPEGYTIMHPFISDLVLMPYLKNKPHLVDGSHTSSGWGYNRWRPYSGSQQTPEVISSDLSHGSSDHHLHSTMEFNSPHPYRTGKKDGDMSNRPVLHMDIGHFERLPGFHTKVRPLLLSQPTGEVALTVNATNNEMETYGIVGASGPCNTGHWEQQPEKRLFRVVYRWRRITNPPTPFVVVLRTVEPLCSRRRRLVELVPEFEFHYHRLDLLKHPQTCLYLRQLATFTFGTIYLAPRAFVHPFTRFSQTSAVETQDEVRHLMAYLLDHTVLISDPGLAKTTPSIRTHVAVVERIGKFWSHRSRTSEMRNFIIRRYVATDAGVMLIYPGTLMPSTFDPTSRMWYQRTLALPGRIVVTGPYLDEGGGGYIITLSRTIFEGNETGLHQPHVDHVGAVIGIDLTYRSLSLLLARWIPDCGSTLRTDHVLEKTTEGHQKHTLNSSAEAKIKDQVEQLEDDMLSKARVLIRRSIKTNPTKSAAVDSNVVQQRCMLVNDQGYLVAHPGFCELRQDGPVEHNHLDYHEPVVAASLLTQSEVVEKMVCVSYIHRSLQRYYSLNLSAAGVIESPTPGDQCVKYQFMVIPKTNLFIGVVREHQRLGCSPRTAFCPCSTKNRRCLNCGRIDQCECECPCECPLGSGIGLKFSNNVSSERGATASPLSNVKPVEREMTTNLSFEKSQRSAHKVLANSSSLKSTSSSEGSYLFLPGSTRETYNPFVPTDYPPCPKLLDLELHHPVPAASLAASFSVFMGFKHAPAICLPNGAEYANDLQLEPSTLSEDSSPHVWPQTVDDPAVCTGRNQLYCSAAVNCEWCFLKPSGHQPLLKPFCAPMATCYNGVFGSRSPYFDDTLRAQRLPKPSGLGPDTWTPNWFGNPDRFTVRPDARRPFPVRLPAIGDPATPQDEYTYRLIELMVRRSKLSNPNIPAVSAEEHSAYLTQRADNRGDSFAHLITNPIGLITGVTVSTILIVALFMYFARHRLQMCYNRTATSATPLFRETNGHSPTASQHTSCETNEKFNPPDPPNDDDINFGGSGGPQSPPSVGGCDAFVSVVNPILADPEDHSDLDSVIKAYKRNGPKSGSSSSSAVTRARLPPYQRERHWPQYPYPEKVHLLTKEEDAKPISPTNETPLSQSQILVVGVPPNPYHLIPSESEEDSRSSNPAARTVIKSSNVSNLARSSASEHDSAVGSDCTTAASATSSSVSRFRICKIKQTGLEESSSDYPKSPRSSICMTETGLHPPIKQAATSTVNVESGRSSLC